jgi:phage terminase large subunit-like protein
LAAELAEIEAELGARGGEALAQYKPLPKLEGWHKSDAMFRILIGGNRAGKTTCGAVEASWWATGEHPYLDTPCPCKILATENTWALVADPMWIKLSQPRGLKLVGESQPILPSRLIRSVAYENKALGIPKKVTLTNGSTIDFKSSDAGREKFEGAEYDLVWIDEEMANPLIFQEIQRGLVDRGGKLIWTATPLARSRATLDLHEAAHDSESPLSVYEAQVSIYDNPYLDPAARDAFIATIPEDYRPTRIGGEFLILEGLVYNDWGKGHWISRDEFDSLRGQHPSIVSIDPGYAHPCVVLWCLLLPGDPRRVVFHRVFYKRRQLVSDVVDVIAKHAQHEPIMRAIIDPESLKKNQAGGASVFEQYEAEIRHRGIKNSVTGGTLRLDLAVNDIEAGIYKVKEFLKPQEGVPGIRAVDDLAMLRYELGRYRWDEETEKKDIPKKPVDKDNHVLDALRYAIMGLPPYVGIPSDTMTRSQMIHDMAMKAMKRGKHSKLSFTIGGAA